MTRHYAYGNVRTPAPPCGGTLPTDYTFTVTRHHAPRDSMGIMRDGVSEQKHDPSTGSGGSAGLMYYGARYYDPTLGRFVSADTLVPNAGNPQSLNRYAYVLNNPVKYADPSGHCTQDLTADRECWALWGQAMGAFEDAPADLDTWDSDQLQILVWWTSRGLRFTARDDPATGNIGAIWTVDNVTTVINALNTASGLLGKKLLPALGLGTGILTFNKWRGINPGGFYHADTNTIDLNLPDQFVDDNVRGAAVEATIHELGHAVDRHAPHSQTNTFLSEGIGWQGVSGWSLRNGTRAISERGQAGAPSRYALSVNPTEDFAETFATAVLGHPRAFSPLGENVNFRVAAFQGRLDLLLAAIRMIR